MTSDDKLIEVMAAVIWDADPQICIGVETGSIDANGHPIEEPYWPKWAQLEALGFNGDDARKQARAALAALRAEGVLLVETEEVDHPFFVEAVASITGSDGVEIDIVRHVSSFDYEVRGAGRGGRRVRLKMRPAIEAACDMIMSPATEGSANE